MPNFMIVRFQTSEITWNKQTDRQTDKQTDNVIYYVDGDSLYSGNLAEPPPRSRETTLTAYLDLLAKHYNTQKRKKHKKQVY